MYVSKSLERRFRAKYQEGTPDECWPWLASINSQGYGQIRDGQHMAAAHRIAVVLDGRPLDTEHVHHRCGTRACVNPAHLEVVADHAEHRLRHLKGCSKHGMADLRRVKAGKTAGELHCAVCNREKAARRRRQRQAPARVAALDAAIAAEQASGRALAARWCSTATA